MVEGVRAIESNHDYLIFGRSHKLALDFTIGKDNADHESWDMWRMMNV